jgi:hypothetical protein
MAADCLIAALRDDHPDAFATALYAAAGDLRREAGDPDGARRAYVEALRHTPHGYTVRARFGLAVLDCEAGDLTAALAHLEAAVAEGSSACRMIAEAAEGPLAALFSAEDEEIRKAVRALTDSERADAPIRAMIEAACRRAEDEGKRVLLHWYGPYCPFVMAMEERLCDSAVERLLYAHFVHVRMDQGSMHKGVSLDAEYGEVMRRLGVPSFFVLDPDGTTYTVQSDADLFDDHGRSYNAAKVAAWLRRVANE